MEKSILIVILVLLSCFVFPTQEPYLTRLTHRLMPRRIRETTRMLWRKSILTAKNCFFKSRRVKD